jgi:transcription initiation factor TFIIE subunit alpha
MQIKLLKDIVSSLIGSAGQKVVDLLYDKKNVNEFLIAKKLGLTINQTRNVLYKLADEGLVSFMRKKDRKKGGWYTYFWTLSSGKSLNKFREKLVKEIEELKTKQHIKKTKQFYDCPNCNIEYSEEEALPNQYACPECGEVLTLKDNTVEIETIGKQIAKLNGILAEVSTDLDIIHVEEDKVRARKIKAEAKKKAKEREVRKKEKAKLLKKEARASGKKAVAKKKKKSKK